MTFFLFCGNIIIMKEIIKLLNENGYEAYVVGGFVRDYMLGVSSKDIDICTNASIDEIIRIFKGRGKAFKQYFAYHIDEDGFSYDITTYRKELKYKRNKPVEIEKAKDFGTDLLRRDFTINTFAIDNQGLFVDMLGARKDFDNRLIKVVGDTNKKLTDDKTRIVRAIRFACTLDFDLDPAIIEFIANKKGHLLNEVTKEFKRSELDKIFDSDGIDKFFYIVKRYNLGKYFNIKFNKVVKTYNKYGVWAQIEAELPFSASEKNIISSIRTLVDKKDIKMSDLMLYSKDIIYNAASILNLEKKIRVFYELLDLHSIIDIDIDPNTLFKYVRPEDIKRVYRLVEKSIMEGYLLNKKSDIEEFIRNL